MATFTFEDFSDLETKRKILKLVKNDKVLCQSFIDDVSNDNNKKDSYNSLVSILEDIANNKQVTDKQYKIIQKCKGLKYKAYEIRKNALRLYTFYDSDKGQIIVIGGDKGSQEKDFKRVKAIIEEYIQCK